MIIEAISKKDQIIEWINVQMKDLDEYEGLYYSFKHLLDKQNFNDFLVVTKDDGTIADLIYKNILIDTETLYPYFIDKATTIKQIKKYYPNAIIAVNYWEGESLIEDGAIQLSMKSSFCDNTYKVLDNICYSFNKENEFLLRDKIEEKYFKQTSDTIEFDIVYGEDVNQYFLQEDYTYPMWQNESNHRNIIGFHYLQPDFFDNNTLLVLKSNNVIIGVIKYGIYGEDKFTHYGLNYIDVNYCYRQKGYAKQLIKKLEEIIPKDYPLVLTDESEMGTKCQMIRHFKEVFHSNIYTRKEWDQRFY